jgi:ADP-ribose pyrophosphatase YjhB (NUDIX family)
MPEKPAKTARNRAFEAVLRPVLHRYWRFSRGLTLGVRGVVIGADARVFLVRHTYTPGWGLPGGGVEARETALEALTRELREETAIEVKGLPRLHGVFFNRRISKRDHVLVYVVRDFEVLEAKRPDREIAEAGFFPLDQLPEDTTPATRRRLAEILKDTSDLPSDW